MNYHPKYAFWTPQDFELLRRAESYENMLEIVWPLLKRIPGPALQVCGPISTGGKGSRKANFAEFDRAISFLAQRHKNVFDQRPFEIPIQRIKMKENLGYPQGVLDEFLLPLFKSGSIGSLYFLPGWETSRGSAWEHEQGSKLGIEITYLPENFADLEL
ncbi:MAG: hypothetical protein Q8Q38_00355 [bacterium]|nr:hypothetical protein [bacterium]